MAVRLRRIARCAVAVAFLAAGCEAAVNTTAAGGTSAQGKPLWLQSVQMTSADAGWAEAQAENPANPSVSPPLLLTRTHDGGRTWADVTPAAARPMLATTNASQALDVVDGQRAYFAVTAWNADSGQPKGTTVLFTTGDAGRTWTESAPLRVTGWVASVSFPEAGHGWLLLSEGAASDQNPVLVYRTADDGRHWSLAASSPPPGKDAGTGIPVSCDKGEMTFPTMTTGWLTNGCNAISPDELLVSRDGGVTWTPQPLPVPLGVHGFSASLSGPEFTRGTGFLIVGQQDGKPSLLVTNDLGRTWRLVPRPVGAGPRLQAQFFSPADGVLVPEDALGSPGNVFFTTSDGGRTWTAVPQGRRFTQYGVTIDFASPRAGFAWIPGGDVQGPVPPPVYETTDSGGTWASFTPRLEN